MDYRVGETTSILDCLSNISNEALEKGSINTYQNWTMNKELVDAIYNPAVIDVTIGTLAISTIALFLYMNRDSIKERIFSNSEQEKSGQERTYNNAHEYFHQVIVPSIPNNKDRAMVMQSGMNRLMHTMFS